MAGTQIEVMASQVDAQRLGFMAMSLTEFGSLLEPQIEAGSVVEIAGALFEFTVLESISGWAGIANSSDVYVKLTVAGTSVTASFTTTAPTWSAAKQGWYNVAETERYVFRLRKNSTGGYAHKRVLAQSQDTRIEVSDLTLMSELTLGSLLAGTNQLLALDEVRTRTTASYYKIKELLWPAYGTVRTYFEIDGAVAAKGRIYINDVATGIERSGTGAGYAAFTEDFSVNAGDRVALYAKGAGGGPASYRNFRLSAATIFGSVLKAILQGSLDLIDRNG